MKEEKFVYRDEYGSIQPIRFAHAKAYDSEDNEIMPPKCEKCGCHKAEVIGKNAFAWICPVCPN